MDPNKVNLNNLHNLDSNIPNPYDPSLNNNMNVSTVKEVPNEVKETPTNPLEMQNDIFNQDDKTVYNEVSQADNYNIGYDSRNQNAKPQKKNMISKYIVFFGVLAVVGIIIYIVSTYIK